MKQRFSSLDVKVIAAELSSTLTGLRLANVYDISSRIFLFRFQQPGRREQLIVESGFRCHLTYFNREIATAPSPFVARIRKCLRSKRLTHVRQIGTDRVLEFAFSDGQFRLVLEFFAGGNVIICDAEYNTLFLLRNVHEGSGEDHLRPGLKYNLHARQNFDGIPELTQERLVGGLQRWLNKQQDVDALAQTKKRKTKHTDSLRRALAFSFPEFPPLLLDHAFSSSKLDTTFDIEEVTQSGAISESLMDVLQIASDVFNSLVTEKSTQGYIVAQKRAADGEMLAAEGIVESDKLSEVRDNLLYEQFHPFKAQQFEDQPNLILLELDGFNKTVDEFFSSLEGQKLQSRLNEREETAKRRLNQARNEHAKRIGGLRQAQALHIRKAQAIETNLERVEEAIGALNGLIAQSMDWTEIARLIEVEQKRGNPVAGLFKLPLKLYENTATIMLVDPDCEDEEDGDFEGEETESDKSDDDNGNQGHLSNKKVASDKMLAIDIDLGISAWSNATQYYEQKKESAVKEQKTLLASDKALKNAEQKITADLKKGLKQEKEILRPTRNPFWFEKFYYFISSDGYLVVGGKDAQQNEIIYTRHFRANDVFVHADVRDATPVFIQNLRSSESPIPPSTLTQAGNLVISMSNAWESKAVLSAWWVSARDVTKVVPSGDYLAPGTFEITGSKNYLPPATLLVGLGVIFQISESSKAKHLRHRVENDAEPDNEEGIKIEEANSILIQDHANDNAENSSDSDEDFPDVNIQSEQLYSDNEEEERLSNPLMISGANFLELPQKHLKLHSEPTKHVENSKLKEQSAVGVAYSASIDENAPAINHVSEKSFGELTIEDKENMHENKYDISSSKGEHESQLRDKRSKGQTLNDEHDICSQKVQEQNKPKQTPLPRGKRSKQKKAAAKYAHQDDEDRELALSLLGHKKGEATKQLIQQSVAERTTEAVMQQQRRREQHQKSQEEGKKREEERRAKMESGEDNQQDGAVEDTIDLGTFVGKPLPGDEILAAIPVCAPWMALSAYKYKIKMQPGLQKKGKAVREVLGKWESDSKDKKKLDPTNTDTEKIWPNEIEHMQSWKDAEVVGVIPVSKVRIVAPAARGTGGQVVSKGKSSRGGRGSKKRR